MILAPVSLYSSLVIQLLWKVAKVLRTLPPIQIENFLSTGAIILHWTPLGTNAVISLFNLS